MRRLLPILLWSAISAAFIGPGTVTTAAAAGAGYGLSLLWALVFSTIACLSLQEASARLTALSGLTLGEALQKSFGRTVPWAVVAAVVLGCAAYQAGNILGAVAGASLRIAVSPPVLALVTCGLAAALLWFGTAENVARILGAVVALMGIAFLVCAVDLRPALGPLLKGSFVPSMPEGSGRLVLGLVGTTVVPYNLFLGSCLARGQNLRDIRLGLGVAVPLGGLISVAVLVTGTAVEGRFTYDGLASALGSRLGVWSTWFFAFGLFCAGLSSAVTAPLASAVSVQSLAADRERWLDNSLRYRAIWIAVLLVGLAFGLSGVRPIPAIILAQAVNGILLPGVAVFLLIAVNDSRLMGADKVAGPLANTVMGISCLIAVLLGVAGIVRAVVGALGRSPPDQLRVFAGGLAVAVLIAIPVVRRILRSRKQPAK